MFPVKQLAVVVPAGILLVWLHHWWFGSKGELRLGARMFLWAIGVSSLVLKAVTMALNDDEVYWLASSYAARTGHLVGEIPMRDLMFRPILALGLSPGATIVAGRVIVFALALACGFLVAAIISNITKSPSLSTLGGTITLMLLAGQQMPVLRPEYVTCFLIVLGAWLLLSSFEARSPQLRLVAASAAFTLATMSSLRQLLFLPGALAAVALCAPGMTRRKSAVLAVSGCLLGALPSLIYLHMQKGSLVRIYEFNVVLTQKMGLLGWSTPAFPLLLLCMSVVGCVLLVKNRRLVSGAGPLSLLWLFSTISLTVTPVRMYYVYGSWLALSVVVTAAGLHSLVVGKLQARGVRMQVLIALAVAWLVCAGRVDEMLAEYDYAAHGGPAQVFVSHVNLLNWLDEVKQDGPVVCVCPYHPIRAQNAWGLWSSWPYCYLPPSELLSDMAGDIEGVLRDQRATVLQWDAWPDVTQSSNILVYCLDRQLIPIERIPALSRRLAEGYMLVQWNGPLLSPFGSGRFLVRRTVELDDRVTVLDDSAILGWSR